MILNSKVYRLPLSTQTTKENPVFIQLKDKNKSEFVHLPKNILHAHQQVFIENI